MAQRAGGFAGWVVLCCAVPLAALGAVLLFDTPAWATCVAAFLALGLIAPHLLAAGSPKDARRPRS